MRAPIRPSTSAKNRCGIDNQVDVISKTFLGLTVACARCHDHKFDPITSKDYYALAGFPHSRHQQAFVDSHQRVAPAIAKLSSLKSTIASLLREAMSQAPERSRGWDWSACVHEGLAAKPTAVSPRSQKRDDDEVVFEDFDRDNFDGWSVTGDAFGDCPSRPCDFRLELTNGASRVRLDQARSGA